MCVCIYIYTHTLYIGLCPNFTPNICRSLSTYITPEIIRKPR